MARKNPEEIILRAELAAKQKALRTKQNAEKAIKRKVDDAGRRLDAAMDAQLRKASPAAQRITATIQTLSETHTKLIVSLNAARQATAEVQAKINEVQAKINDLGRKF